MSAPAHTAAPQSALSARPIPWFGLIAVLFGTFISTLNGRLSTYGLADIRGAVHAGFDDGSWITTAQTAAQIVILPVAIWLGSVFGARRILINAALAFALTSFLEAFSPNLTVLLVFQFAGGLASGFFIPLTLSFIVRNMPPRLWAYGIALYALNLELSLNVSASLEGWYVDHLSWMWIFWQNVPLALGMAACFHFGTAPEPRAAPAPKADLFGLLTSGLGFALVAAALDQGNRVDWLNSGLIVGLLAAGIWLIVTFFVSEAFYPKPFINWRVVFAKPIPELLLLVAFLRLTILSTAFLIPQYLGVVRGFRALEVGQTLNWITMPQLVVCPLAAVMLRRFDARLVSSIGFILIAVACLQVAHGLTPLWSSDQFLVSQLFQALGQSLALSGIVFFAILHLKPQDALTFGAAIQTARLMGGQIGSAFVSTLVRIRGQIASNLIGQHIQSGDASVALRLHDYAGFVGHDVALPAAASRAILVLARTVSSAAATQSVIDGFVTIAGFTALALALVVLHEPAPKGPASHVPLFGGPPIGSIPMPPEKRV